MELLIVIGNLGADAEKRVDNGSEYVKFNVAETRKWTGQDNTVHEETIWNSCIMHGNNDKLLPYLVKGAKVCVIGRCSTRVFSSKQERRMMAGININVDRLELISTNVETVPRFLVTTSGELVPTSKWYTVSAKVAAAEGAVNGKPTIMIDQRNNQYQVDANGFVFPIKTEAAKTEQPAEEAKPVEEANDNIPF